MIDYFGITDVAERLNVSPGAVSNWRRRGSWPDGFPEPAAQVRGAPLWTPRVVEAYVKKNPPGERHPRTRHPNPAKRDREIRRLRAKGETLAAIGERYGLSRQRVQQIVTLDSVRSHN